MKSDDEGFLYPIVEIDNCIQCGLCENVCPVINQSESSLPTTVFAAKNIDKQVVGQSSSGGVFKSLAETIIQRKGIVFGAKFDKEWGVVHSHTDSHEGLLMFQSSKYVQSDVRDSYQKTEFFLKEGRAVLFSGTPCQIAGLKAFLRKDYDNLITVSIICHGVPSPGIWKDYIKQIQAKLVAHNQSCFSSQNNFPIIIGINFRDKTEGWQKYSFCVKASDGYCMHEYYRDNLFIRGFLNNIYLRPSCYQCPARKGKSGADIQLGDYWGVKRRTPDFYDPNGVSLVLLYTKKGAQLFNELDLLKTEITYDDVLDCNANIEVDEFESVIRSDFFKSYRQHGIKAIAKYCDKIEGRDLIWHIKKCMFKVKQLIKK